MRRGLLLLAGVLAPCVGCNIMGPLLYLAAPPQTKPTEHKLPERGEVGLFIEFARPEQENTVFVAEFERRLGEILRERKAFKRDLISMREVYRLRREHADFKEWGLQRVARELEADELIYVRINDLKLRTQKAVQIMEPSVEVYLRVISTSEPSSAARVWPGRDESEGRKIARARPPREATTPMSFDDEAGKLARELAILCAMPFYEVDAEEKIPWEK